MICIHIWTECYYRIHERDDCLGKSNFYITVTIYLISRIFFLQYMHENENKVYIDVNEMADALQRRYRDYRNKKRAAFRGMVRRAYDELTEIFARKPSVRESPAFDDDDFEDVDVEVFRNIA